jgi:site-specific DNA-methyltransferase (adenine-specific)
MNAKSPRNKTLELTAAEQRFYLARCPVLPQASPPAPSALINTTILGDFFAVAPLLPQGQADLLIVDPPYNLYKQYHGRSFSKQSAADYADFTRRWLEACLPLLKSTATVYVCCDWRSGLIIGNLLEDYLTVRNRITWQREKGRGAASNWKNSMEDIWFATVSGDYTFNAKDVRIRRKVRAPYRENGEPKDWIEDGAGRRFRDTAPSNFWDDLTVPFWSMPENTPHPTQKPEKLLARLILASSQPDDLVLDPFLGSGTTSVVAKKLGRRYLGVEQNPLYCAWAEKRLELAAENPRIQGYEDGVFWERNIPLK